MQGVGVFQLCAEHLTSFLAALAILSQAEKPSNCANTNMSIRAPEMPNMHVARVARETSASFPATVVSWRAGHRQPRHLQIVSGAHSPRESSEHRLTCPQWCTHPSGTRWMHLSHLSLPTAIHPNWNPFASSASCSLIIIDLFAQIEAKPRNICSKSLVFLYLLHQKTTKGPNYHYYRNHSWGSSMSWKLAEALSDLVHSEGLSSFASTTEACHPIAARSPVQPPWEAPWGTWFFQVWTSQVFRTYTGEGQHINIVDDHFLKICACSEGSGNPTTHCDDEPSWVRSEPFCKPRGICWQAALIPCPQELFKWGQRVSFPACPTLVRFSPIFCKPRYAHSQWLNSKWHNQTIINLPSFFTTAKCSFVSCASIFLSLTDSPRNSCVALGHSV